MTFTPDEGFHCSRCGRAFRLQKQLEMHRRDAPDCDKRMRGILASERPRDRGPIPCGQCPATFSNETNAQQHRRDKHREG